RNAAGAVVDEVKYSDHDPWPMAPDGHSPSLERICPFASGSDPSNWGGSVIPAVEKPAGSPGRTNHNFSPKPRPVISNVSSKTPPPGQKAIVSAEVSDPGQIKAVTLLWRIASSGSQTSETEVPMERISGDNTKGQYRAAIEGQPEGTLVR